jgi:hypothetical protein
MDLIRRLTIPLQEAHGISAAHPDYCNPPTLKPPKSLNKTQTLASQEPVPAGQGRGK